MSHRPPAPPGTLPLHDALGRSEPLTRLLERLREAEACHAAVQPLLPAGLREQVRPGPLDDDGWSLIAASGAAAAKLRQLLPTLHAALRAQGRDHIAIRVRVQPPSPPAKGKP